MLMIQQTESFAAWFDRLRDTRAQARITARLTRLSTGHLGDVKPIGEGVSKLRIDYGPGHRVYFTKNGNTIVLFLYGGDNSSQARDIQRAKELAK